jgi:hypothetical protein
MCTLAAAVTALAAVASAQPAGQDFNMGGTQVWNAEYWQSVQIGDFYGPNYKIRELRPISLVGVRNGAFSGYFVVTNANGPITGLKVKAGDLAGPEGRTIPAAAVRIRYASLRSPDRSWTLPYRFDALLDAPPDEVPIVDPKHLQGLKTPNTEPVAMQPVWVTVSVPKDAAPGDYEGKISIDVDNPAITPLAIVLRLKVHDWQLADPRDYFVQNLGWMLPEREAEWYKIPAWSDKHFAMLARTFELMMQLGSRQVQVNLTTHYPSVENSETLVTWVRARDGSFTYDFTLFDKYMDLVARVIGKPFPIRLNMWTVKRTLMTPPLPRVRVRDAETGKVEELDQPDIGTPASLAFWKPVLDGVRERMEKRGWFGVTAPNWIEYCGGPTPAAVSMLRRIWPDGTKWCDIDHGRRQGFAGERKEDYTPVLTQSTVWNEGTLTAYDQWRSGPYPRGYRNLPVGVAICGHARGRHREWSPLWVPRTICEELMMRGNHGIDPVGADMWPVKDANGRYPIPDWAEFALGPGNAVKAYLAPGPDGPVATEWFEAFREGVQYCEAIFFMQKAIEAGKITGPLLDRVNKVLDDRARGYVAAYKSPGGDQHPVLNPKALAAGIQERDAELFAVAGEVAKAIGTSRTILPVPASQPGR